MNASLYAQKLTLKEADRCYAHFHFASAIPLYESWVLHHPEDIETKKKLADCYLKINDSKNGERIYSELVKNDAGDQERVLNYAQMLEMNGKYTEASKYFKLYKKDGGDARGERFIMALSNIENFYRDSADVEIDYLSINSSQEDFSPAFYKKGLVFCSARNRGEGIRNTFNWNHSTYLDLYYAIDTTSITEAEYNINASKKRRRQFYKDHHSDETDRTSNDSRTLGYYYKSAYIDSLQLMAHGVVAFNKKLNTKYHEGPLVFSKDEEYFIFTRNNYYKGKYRTDSTGINRLKLYIANKVNEDWDIVEFPYNSDKYSVGHPALSPDNKILYFASDMPGGKGGSDIWYCVLKDNGWSKPVNLTAVNTEGQEVFPFIDQQGDIYFASNGWAGLGGLDIFYLRLSNISSMLPYNVGYPINSMKDDFGLIVRSNGRSGYFTSSRNGDKTSDDIFAFKSKQKLFRGFSIAGLATEERSNKLLEDVAIVLLDDNNNEIGRTTTDANGAYNFEVEPNRAYLLKAEKNDYLSFNKEISTAGIIPGKPSKFDIVLPRKGVYVISCRIVDRKTEKLLDSVKVVLTDAASGKRLYVTPEPASGAFSFIVPDVKNGDPCNLILRISRKDYLSKVVSYQGFFEEPAELKLQDVMDVRMDKIDLGTDIGKLVKINPIYFDVGKAIIRADAAKELDKIVQVMMENPGMKIELGSHTDSRGSDAANLNLSDKRAKASAAYIASKGIMEDRIVGKGYGESRLANNCSNDVKCSDKEHQLNRRTEFLVIAMGE
ncbi:OmpA family protein [Fulvivirgaceae bacterium PWU20]|uniref:OmpA family protein n=1 Tax=Chryseosolibacter indicus TaxID=2782351 RepID=A0ABS5VYC1_9BACT|nr:OmpA family protein [Chryseosolibacter indicus]